MAKRQLSAIQIDGVEYNLSILTDLTVLDQFVAHGEYEIGLTEYPAIKNTDFAPIKADATVTTNYDTNLVAKFQRYVRNQEKAIMWYYGSYPMQYVAYNGSGTQAYYSIILDDDAQEAWVVAIVYQNNTFEKNMLDYGGSDLYNAFYLPYVPPTPPGPQGDATCKVNYYLQDDEYTYSKITFKEDTPPIDMNDGYVEDISASQSSVNIENLVEGQKYYFTIFTDKSESESFPYIVGPVITDWVNAELPSPMLCDETTKPYKYETQTEMSSMIEKDIKALGYKLTVSKNLYNNLIPTGSSSKAFWIFGNNQRGLYVYYQNVSRQACIFMKAYYKNSVLFDEQLEVRASAISARNGYIYFGKNDITKKGSTVFISMSRAGTSGTIRPFVINDTTMYYFITNRPNPADYEWYINQINGTGFTWKDLARNSGSGYNKYPFSDYSQWRSDNGSTGSFDITANGDAYVFQTEKSRIDIVTTDYVTYSAILNPVNPFEREYYDSFSTYGYYTVGKCRYNSKYQYVIQGMTDEVNGYPYTATGTLEEVLTYLVNHCRNVSIYVNGDCWSEV